MAEGVRDDFKVMTGIYSRLCAYLDHVATAPVPTPTAATAAVTNPSPPIGGVAPAGSPTPEPTLAPPAAAGARESAALSTFVAPPAPPSAAAAGAVSLLRQLL